MHAAPCAWPPFSHFLALWFLLMPTRVPLLLDAPGDGHKALPTSGCHHTVVYSAAAEGQKALGVGRVYESALVIGTKHLGNQQERLILAHSSRSCSPWLLDTVALGLRQPGPSWAGRGCAWWNKAVQPHGSQEAGTDRGRLQGPTVPFKATLPIT